MLLFYFGKMQQFWCLIIIYSVVKVFYLMVIYKLIFPGDQLTLSHKLLLLNVFLGVFTEQKMSSIHTNY